MLPNVVIIGAQKCGTSALHFYLSLHPEVSMSNPKELNFFVEERNWSQGLDWYERQFDPDAKARGESSPLYTTWPRFEGVPERMHAVVPDAKLIFLVRDPIERIVSGYVHNYTKGRATKNLAKTVLDPGANYILRSRYHSQVQRFLEVYPRSQLLVLEQEELLEQRPETLQQVFRFVGVDDSFYHEKYERLRHQTSKKRRSTTLARVGERMPERVWSRVERKVSVAEPVERPRVGPKLRRRLVRELGDDIAAFRELTGREFAHWSV